jgi:hypothetical protein
MLTVRSTTAHDNKHHPLDQAHSATATPTGALVYVICGWQGCPHDLAQVVTAVQAQGYTWPGAAAALARLPTDHGHAP